MQVLKRELSRKALALILIALFAASGISAFAGYKYSQATLPATVSYTPSNLSGTIPCTYLIETDGTYYYAIDCNTHALAYGGASNAGGATGTIESSVINSSITATGTKGGTIVLIGLGIPSNILTGTNVLIFSTNTANYGLNLSTGQVSSVLYTSLNIVGGDNKTGGVYGFVVDMRNSSDNAINIERGKVSFNNDPTQSGGSWLGQGWNAQNFVGNQLLFAQSLSGMTGTEIASNSLTFWQASYPAFTAKANSPVITLADWTNLGSITQNTSGTSTFYGLRLSLPGATVNAGSVSVNGIVITGGTGGTQTGISIAMHTASDTGLTITTGNTNLQQLTTNGILTMSSGLAYHLRVVSTNVSITTADNFVVVNTASGNIVFTLPTAVPAGTTMTFVKSSSDANTVTINRGGADNIQGLTSKTLTTQWAKVTLVSDGAGDWIDMSIGGV